MEFVSTLRARHMDADAVGSLGATINVPRSQLALARATLRQFGFERRAHVIDADELRAIEERAAREP